MCEDRFRINPQMTESETGGGEICEEWLQSLTTNRAWDIADSFSHAPQVAWIWDLFTVATGRYKTQVTGHSLLFYQY